MIKQTYLEKVLSFIIDVVFFFDVITNSSAAKEERMELLSLARASGSKVSVAHAWR